ncbi:nad dependent epimerase dehydratase family protein [Fusarium oxysporum f. sp. phaseoli]
MHTMPHNILLTGASGYLGGDLLAELVTTDLPEHGKLFALVRSSEQADAVKHLGAEPLILDVRNEDAVREAILSHEITIAFFLIDAVSSASQQLFIKALGELKKKTGYDVHFLHTTGAKMFSSHSGAPTNRKLSDDDPELFAVQKAQRAPLIRFQEALDTNNTIIELSEANQVKSYIFAPCIVYGNGRGFGNPISIQTVAIVQAAKALRRVYRTDAGDPIWPVAHIADNTNLYVQILRTILIGQDPGHGKLGYYLASSGSVPWNDIYNAFAKALAQRGVIDDATVQDADDEILQKMADALNCPKDFVAPQLGGTCTFVAEHGRKIGWKPTRKAEDILVTADEEVNRILQHLKA